jgi:hypothetical protein
MNLDFLPSGPITFLPDALRHVHLSRHWLLAGGILLALFALWLLFHPRKRQRHAARLGGLTWRRNQFCRGWLITGDTGSGKTSSGINQLAYQVFQNEPRWGGLCIDEKGVYWETLSAMARHYGREHDLIHLQIRDAHADSAASPAHRYNLTGDRSIPFTTYAKFIVDTATSLGQGGDKGFLKLLYYNHALRRFDKSKSERAVDNLLILWADEAQRFMTASDDGTSDYNCVDVIREAAATIVAAAQSTTSLIPPLGNDKSKVLTLNLRNRMIFRAADEGDAVQAADFLGKKRVVKRSWGYSAGKRNVNYSETEEHKLKPHKLRSLRDHECVLVHCERGFRRVRLPPLDADGRVPAWYSSWR